MAHKLFIAKSVKNYYFGFNKQSEYDILDDENWIWINY